MASAVLMAAFGVFNFLATATTGAVARRVGADDRAGATRQGVAGIWLAAGIGTLIHYPVPPHRSHPMPL